MLSATTLGRVILIVAARNLGLPNDGCGNIGSEGAYAEVDITERSPSLTWQERSPLNE